jgi:hypothetical protein
MRRLLFLIPTLLLLVPVVSAQDKTAPVGQPPRLWLASAFDRDGKVVVQIAQLEEQGGPGGPGGFEPGVKTVPATTVMKWCNLRPVTLGKTAQAFRVNGERVEANLVLKALAKPKGVAVFVRTKESDPANVDPFYLALLREDALVLVVNDRDIYPQEP